MEKAEHELLLAMLPSNETLRKLYQQHSKLERQVENMSRYTSYSTAAQLRQQALKKEKLKMKETIMSILLSTHKPELTPSQ